MYCLSKNGLNLVDTKSLHIERRLKDRFKDGGYTEKYTILANDDFNMSEFTTLDEAKEQLRIAMRAIGEGKSIFEF